jgi:hypothetical protein
MKLRNKKTGEIIDIYKGEITLHYNQGRKTIHFKCLEDLEEWEDYEEPKEYYAIDLQGDIIRWARHSWDEKTTNKIKGIGNYFETDEEAEKAVEKLKAWTRLKDKGFRFKEWESYEETSGLSFPDRHIVNSYTAIFDFNKPCRKHEIENEVKADLDLLFGGEE